MIFADTGAWFSLFSTQDQNHLLTLDWVSRNKEDLLTTDYVIDETLTLMKARGEYYRAQEIGKRFFAGTLATIYYLTEEDILQAWSVFEQFSDKEWSFTDCASKVVMEKFHITHAFGYDHHFRQFGSVKLVP